MGKGGPSPSQKPRTKVVPTRVTGRVMGWRGKYGWIQPSQPIKHPSALARNGGKLYFGQEDVEAKLSGVNAAVTFFVYESEKGLGAMHVRPDARELQPARPTKTTAMGKKPTVSTFPGKTQGKGQGRAQGKTHGKAAPGLRTKLLPQRLTGTVKKWMGNFGWIAPTERISHPAARMHKGELYLAKEDVEAELSGVGAKVSFFLYKDDDGLGAMHVRPAAGGATPRGSVQKQAKAATKLGVQKQLLKQKLKQKVQHRNKNDENKEQQRTKKQNKPKTKSTAGNEKVKDRPRKRVSNDLVFGEIVDWKRNFGFIKPVEPVEHAGKKTERIYVNARDLVEGKSKQKGTLVQFYVYESASGFGAEEVS